MQSLSLALLLLAGLGLAFYFVVIRGAKSTVTKQILQNQHTIARAQTGNMVSFFEVFGESIAIRAKLTDIQGQGVKKVEESLKIFVEQWQDNGVVAGIALTDKNGIVIANANTANLSGKGVSLSDRDYFQWAKESATEGDYFVGKAVVSRLGASKDKIIVPVASPVYQNETFAGVLVASVSLSTLTDRYLHFMNVSGQTHVYLVDREGNFLYDNLPSEVNVGDNVYELLDNPEFSEEIRTALKSTKDGGSVTTFLDNQSGDREMRAVTYSPIVMGERKWLLIMDSPISDEAGMSVPIYVRQTIMLAVTSITFILIGIIFSREKKQILGQNPQDK